MITKHISKGRRVMTGLLVVGPAIATVLLVVGLARAAEGSFADSILTTYRDMPSAKADWNASGKAKLASSSSISVTTLTVTLPISAYLTSAVYVPSSHKAYIFGGRDPSGAALNDIVEYDIARGTITVTATLPISIYGSSAVYVPSTHRAYIFGGSNPTIGTLDDIVEYDIAGATAAITATLPFSSFTTSAVYVSSSNKAYIFGGYDSRGDIVFDDVVEYDIASGTATVTATLPISRLVTSAVYVPSSHRAYIFGGRDPSLRALNDVVEYDIARGTIAVTATLPISTYGTSAVYVPSDHKAYIFGGRDPSAGVLKNDIVEYDITDSTAIMLSATLPISVYLTSAVYVPYSHNAYVFGGRAQGTTVDDIVRINFGYDVYLPIILKSYP